MQQLTGLDAAFLYMETPTTYGHVNGLSLYQRPSPDFKPYEVVRERFAAMVGHIEPLRRRVAEVPFGLDHPYWFDDPEFDLDYHVREIGLAPPGNQEQLGEQVARIIGRKMDRRHPLWEVYVIEGLDDGHWALLTKFHHATIDGAAGVIMLRMMTELAPDAEFPFVEVPWRGEPVPSDAELLQHTMKHLMANPVKATRLSLRMVRNFADAAGITSLSGAATRAREVIASVAGRSEESAQLSEQLRKVSMPLTPAPPTPWNKAVGPHRRFAMRSVSLDDIKVLKNATGGTVNDVVMAICAGALREYLLRHDALPDAPLRSMVPVSVRTGLEEDPWTNLVSSLVAELPTDCDDPLERVARCREAMQIAKQQLDLVPADAIMRATDVTSPMVATAAIRLQARLADRFNMPVNVVISNVPGPREPLYMAGAKLDGYIPVSTISNGVGLNITVHSYEDRLDFGLVADRDLVPDLWDLVDLHMAQIDALFEATGAERPGAPAPKAAAKKPAAKRTKSAAKKSAAKKSTAKKSAAKRSRAKRAAS
ncbi:MAG: wax ester/triacylglycerol synthase family O-acyltransferase [Ilumatobacter sp.]|nr:wax ester/triacylglycerol synthase family O-acyltransferase [Ilumatobacter sp.]